MKLPLLGGVTVDLNDDLDLYFFHEHLQWHHYNNTKSLIEDKKSVLDKIHLSDYSKMYLQRANTGGWQFAEKNVYDFDEVLFEFPNECKTMCISKKDDAHDTLIIQLVAYGGHELRLKFPFSATAKEIYNCDADVLLVNDSPLRFPEFLHPSFLLMGCSDRLDTMEKMSQEIRDIIKLKEEKENNKYKKIVVYADSRHAGSGVSLACYMSDIVDKVFIVHGTTVYNFDESPIVKSYFKDNNSITSPVQWMHLVKTYQLTHRYNIDNRLLDPFRYLNEYDIEVDYYYGKYDEEYKPFLHYAMQFNNNNIEFHEVDYKFSETSTHWIRSHVDKKILPEYIRCV